MAIHGPANAAVQQAVDRAVSEGGEVGVQVAAYLNGEQVIDAWAGSADPATDRRVDGDTLFNIFSVSKAVVSATVHLQAERGLIDYDAPIARYWPEWGCNGKEKATVRDALSHSTGVPQMPEGTTPETMCDWDFMVAGIARLSPMYPVGETPAYQALNFGWVLGEVVRRTDPEGRSYRRFIREELCEPLGIRDLWMGIDDRVEPRIAKLVNATGGGLPPEGSAMAKAAPANVQLVPEVYEQPQVRRGCLPATGGIASARSLARFWAMLANGGELDGVRLLSRERIDAACVPRPGNQPDPVFYNAVMPLSQGGFWMHDDRMPVVCPAKGRRTICVPGAGGSLGWADPDTGLAVAFCHNRMTSPATCEEHPAREIADTIRRSLDLDP